MGFTNVAWESRSTEQLARDLTDGPGPTSVGQAGAAWIRLANELVGISGDYDRTVDQLKASFASQGGDAAARKLDDFGKWLQAVSLGAAANGQRAEEAAVAYSVAVLAMPAVSEAIETRTAHDVMASLAAYNGAILNGQFADLDEAQTADRVNASAVMYQYEDACNELAEPWTQAPSPDVTNSAALKAQRHANADDGSSGAGGATGTGHSAAKAISVPPPPLAPFRPGEVKSSAETKRLSVAGVGPQPAAAAGMGGMGGYGPMAGALGRSAGREYESSLPAGTLDGGGESGAGLSAVGAAWLPAAHSDGQFLVSDVSWSPNTSAFDDLAAPDQTTQQAFADETQPTLEHVSRQWVSPPVIGVDRGLRL